MEPFVFTRFPGGPGLFLLESWIRRFTGLSAGFTSRIGGAGKDRFASLNCALHVGDDPQTVIHDRKKIADTLGIPFASWTCAEQVHGCEVAFVTEAELGKGRLSREDAIPAKDGMVTDRPGIWLTAFYADCVPLYFCDPRRGAVGLAHAGWKGTVGGIAVAMVRKMREAFGSLPQELLAAIGPSIGGCCYEVDDAVMVRVAQVMCEHDLSNEANRCYRRKEDGRTMLDLREINRQLLVKAGILPINIEVTHLCTGCDIDLFFSHRKERGNTGRMAAWIGMNLAESATVRT